jgi:hypothetical protein
MWNNESVLAGQCAQWIERAPVKAICTSRSLMLPGAPVPAIPRGRGAFASLPPKATCPLLNSFHRSAGNLSPVGDSCAGKPWRRTGERSVGVPGGHGWPRWLAAWPWGGTRGSRPLLPCFRTRAISHRHRVFHRAEREGPRSRFRCTGAASSSSSTTCSSSVLVAGRNAMIHRIGKKGVVIALVGYRLRERAISSSVPLTKRRMSVGKGCPDHYELVGPHRVCSASAAVLIKLSS